MKTLIWKEIRQNLKWALLCLIALWGTEFHELLRYSYSEEPVALVKPAFLTITTWGCAAVGLLLGLLQILPEQSRDRWAALLHRPARRDTILFGKIIAGLLLYLASTVPPFLTCVWYAKIPGHFPILFSPSFMTPGWVDVAKGVMFYFAGLFAGLKRGPWYSSRVFAIIAAMIIDGLADGLYWWAAYVVIGVAALVFFLVAYGAMRSNGSVGEQPLPSRIALGLTHLIAIFAVLVVGIAVLTPLFPTPYPSPNDQYKLLEDGTPTIVGNAKLTDLSGKPIEKERLKTASPASSPFLNFSQITTTQGGHGPHSSEPYSTYRQVPQYALQLPAPNTRGEYWYYLKAERIIVGYSQPDPSKPALPIGSIGEDGFHPDRELAKPFTDPLLPRDWGNEYRHFQHGNKVLLVDAPHRQLTTMYDGSMGPIRGVWELDARFEGNSSEALIAVALDKQMAILDKTGTRIALLPLLRDLDRYGNLAVAYTARRERFVIESGPNAWDHPELDKSPTYWDVMDSKGNLLNSYTLPPLNRGPIVRSHAWQEDLIVGISPVAFWGTYLSVVKIGAILGSEELRHSWNTMKWRGLGHPLRLVETLPFLLAGITLAWARSRHFSWKRALGWSLFVFLFNLAGLITFRLISDWPVLVKCPKCTGSRDPKHAACPHCHEPWPEPTQDGTEIIERVEAAAPAALECADMSAL